MRNHAGASFWQVERWPEVLSSEKLRLARNLLRLTGPAEKSFEVEHVAEKRAVRTLSANPSGDHDVHAVCSERPVGSEAVGVLKWASLRLVVMPRTKGGSPSRSGKGGTVDACRF